MTARAEAWRRQARSDMAQAEESQAAGRAEWACYAASQAAEKNVKAGLIAVGATEVWGHNIVALLQRLSAEIGIPAGGDLIDDAKVLTQFNVLARYPAGEDAVAPADLLTNAQGAGAVAAAERLVDWVNRHVFSD
jgi:HEPN domain-containing protein